MRIYQVDEFNCYLMSLLKLLRYEGFLIADLAMCVDVCFIYEESNELATIC